MFKKMLFCLMLVSCVTQPNQPEQSPDKPSKLIPAKHDESLDGRFAIFQTQLDFLNDRINYVDYEQINRFCFMARDNCNVATFLQCLGKSNDCKAKGQKDCSEFSTTCFKKGTNACQKTHETCIIDNYRKWKQFQK